MTEVPSESFEIVGDPNKLPEAFYEALAGLLLDIARKKKESEPEDEENAA